MTTQAARSPAAPDDERDEFDPALVEAIEAAHALLNAGRVDEAHSYVREALEMLRGRE